MGNSQSMDSGKALGPLVIAMLDNGCDSKTVADTIKAMTDKNLSAMPPQAQKMLKQLEQQNRQKMMSTSTSWRTASSNLTQVSVESHAAAAAAA